MKSESFNLEKIKLLILDFDGTLTDNKVIIDENGNEYVKCNRSDGLGIQLFKKIGIKVICLSSEKNKVVKRRCEKLEIECIQGIMEKDEEIKNYCEINKYSLDNVAFIGNDLNDISALRIVGFPIVVNDANKLVKSFAKINLKRNGGDGVVLEFLQLGLTNQKIIDLFKS